MCCKPCASHGPVGPYRVATAETDRCGHGPDIGIMTHVPSIVHTIETFRRTFPISHGLAEETEQRHFQLTEIGDIRRPIVLFEIDIDGIVAAPWRHKVLVPQPLEIGRNAFCPRT